MGGNSSREESVRAPRSHAGLMICNACNRPVSNIQRHINGECERLFYTCSGCHQRIKQADRSRHPNICARRNTNPIIIGGLVPPDRIERQEPVTRIARSNECPRCGINLSNPTEFNDHMYAHELQRMESGPMLNAGRIVRGPNGEIHIQGGPGIIVGNNGRIMEIQQPGPPRDLPRRPIQSQGTEDILDHLNAVLNLLNGIQLRQQRNQPQGLGAGGINEITTIEFDPKMKWDPDEMKCKICLMDYEARDKIKILPCLHKFHEDCAGNWLTRNATCPICRSSLLPNGDANILHPETN